MRRIRRPTWTLLAVLGALAGTPATAAGAGPPSAVPGEIIVGFEARASAAEHAAARATAGAKLERRLADPSFEVLDVATRGAPVSRALARLRAHRSVRFAEPNHVAELAVGPVRPDDPEYPRQWALERIGMPASWAYTTGSAAVKVAVLDTGVALDHPDLASQLDRAGHDVVDGDSEPDDPHGHGTHVAGTIGAAGDNGIGVAGVAWRVRLVPLRICGTVCTTADQADALLRAGGLGVRVVNMSLAGFDHSSAVDAAVARHPEMLVVAAAGNVRDAGETRNADVRPTYPCALARPNVICVAASNAEDGLSSSSFYGAETVDLAAPGAGIVSTRPAPALYGTASGTSMAAPHVAGVLALLAAANPGARAKDLREAVLSSVTPVASLQGKVVSGGRLDARAALAALDRTGPATTITDGPPALTREKRAIVAFTHDESPADAECRLDEGAWTPCTSPFEVAPAADGLHVLEVRGTDALGNVGPAARRSWTLDTTAPDVRIDAGPPATADRRTATLAFTASEAAAFSCELDGAAPAPCSSPATFDGLADGPHAVVVRATDAAGNAGQATWSWTVDAAPATTIRSGPAALDSATRAAFEFDAPGATGFECQVDGGGWAACASPFVLDGVGEGRHAFEVRALDGVHEPLEVTTWAWTVDRTPPALALLSGPAGVVAGRSAAVAFDPGDAVAVACRVDAGTFAACASPFTVAGLGDGAHAVTVRAVDAAGNVATATQAWTVDATGPALNLTSGPAATVPAGTAVTFTFDADPAAFVTCALDGAPLAPCGSPAVFAGLPPGEHTLVVRATDAVGNATTVERGFVVAAPAAAGEVLGPVGARRPRAVARAVARWLRGHGTPAALRRSHGLRVRWAARGPGVLRVAVVLRGRRPVTVAAGRRRYVAAGSRSIAVRPRTAARLLGGRATARLRVTATFTPARGGDPVTATRSLTLRR